MQTTKNLFRLLMLAIAALCLPACSNTYSAKAIEVWVMDAETKKPLEGVIVVAHWGLSYGPEGGEWAQLQVMETVTDKSGRFYFPAWGPKEIPKDLPFSARLKNNDPGLIMFYPQYDVVRLANDKPIRETGDHGASVRTSDWNGKTIQMKPLSSPREYQASLSTLSGSLYFSQPFSPLGRGCDWIRTPRMIATLINEEKRLSGNREAGWYALPRFESFENDTGCGSAAELLKDYLK